MKFASWNVNGLRACIKKDFKKFFELDFDVIVLQEIKALAEQVDFDFGEYETHWNSARRKGYSGTLLLCKKKPLEITRGLGKDFCDNEGRVITAEFKDFYFVGVYTPNSKRGLLRLSYRLEWENEFRKYVSVLKQKKPVIICGDLNVAHKEIDLTNPKANVSNPGFTLEEREAFENLLEAGFIDIFRALNPKERAYTWWSYMSNARERNIGWRIDYFLISNDLNLKAKNAEILSSLYGSDHCPVTLEI